MIWAVTAWVIYAVLVGALLTEITYRVFGKYSTVIFVAVYVAGIAFHFI